MRIAFLVSLWLCLPLPALAFKGRVVDQDGKPVANATVSVLGRTGEAITDGEGRFVFQPDPPVPFEILVIDATGRYAKPVLIESLDAGVELVITVSPLLNESAAVTGSAPSIESTPGAATASLSARDLAVRQPANLVQAIENVAGVSQVSEGQAAVPAIRGLARGRTLILIDGARVSSERRVGPSATFMDPSTMEGIDVARGPGSVAYGSDAFGGVISVRTRRVAPGSPWAFHFSGTAGGGGLSERRAFAEVSRGLSAGGVLAAVHTRKADDWSSPEGEVFNSGYSDYGFLVRGEQKVGAGYLTGGVQSDFGRDIERPRNNSRTIRFYYPWEDSHRITTSYELRHVAGLQRVAVSGFIGTHTQRTDQDRAATPTTGRVIERADTRARDFHVRGFAEKLVGAARVELGLDVNGRFGLHAVDDLVTYDLAGAVISRRPNVSIDRASRVDTGVYGSIDAAVAPGLTLSGGLRGDAVATRNRGGYFGNRSTSNKAASGYVSATLGGFKGVSITGQLARGFRDPTLSDRYYRGPTGRGFITGNPDLDPETSLQVDLGIRYVAPAFRLGAFAYSYAIHDLIERYATATDFFFFRNRSSARIRGVEIEAQAALPSGFTLDLAAQAAEGRALDTNAPLDDIPPITVTAVLRKAFAERAFAQLRVASFSDDDRFGPTEQAVPGYTLVDASAGARLARPLEVRVQCRNLFNATYYASPDIRAVFAPGRSVEITAAVKF